MPRAWVIALLSVFVASFSTGCKQAEGERCQLDSDCEDSLVCCTDPDHLNQGGVCCNPALLDGGTDGAMDSTVDGAAGDGAPDAGDGAADTGTPDTRTLDTGTLDTGTLDTGTPDTNPGVDSGT